MNFKAIFDMVLMVVQNKYVIITFVGIAVYISFINYIIRYKKRSLIKKAKVKKAIASVQETPPAPPPAEGGEAPSEG